MFAPDQRFLLSIGAFERMIERVTTAPRPDLVPPVALSAGPLGAVQAADREIARQTALRARAVAEFAASRPASADRPQGEPGAMSAERWAARPELLRDVSEWAAQELSVALSITASSAETLLERSSSLVHRLPGTLAALEAGALHPGHLFPMLEKVAPIEDDSVRGQVESGLLAWASGRVTTPAQLGARARREVLRRDARAAVRALERALRERGVSWSPGRVDGMGSVTAELTLPESRALVAALGRCADAVEDEPGAPVRTRGQKMADCLLDLVLRPTEHDLPPVQVALTLVAPVACALGGDQPAEIDGEPVPAHMARELLRAVTGADLGRHVVASGGSADADEIPWDGPLPTPDELAAEAAEQHDFARWEEQLVERILAGEFDGSGREPAAVPEHAGPGPAAAPPVTAGSHEGCWWAEADRVVEEAGQSLLQAHRATARAAAAVRGAAASDAGDEAVWQAGPGGRLSAAEDAMTALTAATATQREELGRLLGTTGGGGLVERPRIAVTDRLTGALLALTDLTGLRRVAHCGAPACRRRPERCRHDLTGRPGLGPPGPTDAYRPGAELDRFLRARDRRCRFPGCRRRVPRGGELDHDRAWPDGPTSAANLVGYCTADHRGKHQAPNWQHELAADGTLTVTTPTGLVAVTDPPPY